MKKTKKNLPAYTLIEALITVAIISIVTAVLISNYTNSRITQQLESSAREVEAAVREIQSYALTGYQDRPNTDPCRFEIKWTASSPVYTLNYFYKDTNDACNPSQTLATYSLRNGVTFSTSGNFSFAPPWGVPSFSGNNQPIVLTLSGSSHAVCVYQSGLINNLAGSSCPTL